MFPLDIFCYKSSVSREIFIKKAETKEKLKWRKAKLIATELTVAKLIASMVGGPSMIAMFFINEILGRVSSTAA